MAKPINMPALSPSMTEGTLARWVKKEGESISVGDVIAEVETDKATMDLESFDEGTLLKILVKEGSQIPVNAKIAIVGKAGETIDPELLKTDLPAPAAEPPKEQPKQETKPEPKPEPKKETPAPSFTPSEKAPITKLALSLGNQPSATPSPSTTSGKIKASPLAKKIAEEKGIPLSRVKGTGPGGRIVERDILHAESIGIGQDTSSASLFSGPVANDERIPLSNMRKTIAKRLLESKTQIPHFYEEIELDAEPLIQARAAINDTLAHLPEPQKISVNDIILKACATAMRKEPRVNASFEGDAIRQHGSVHLAVAVAIPDGLITPVIRDAQNKSIVDISIEAKNLASKAKAGKLTPEEYTGGTFTVSNLGMMGIEKFTAIINPPQAAILAVGTTVTKPIVNNSGQIVPGKRMILTLSADHRVVDGAVAATYLMELKRILENPTLLLL